MHKIAIVGTGVSGLAAAIEIGKLAQRGSYSLTVFESRHIPGGRTRSYIDPETGDTLDNGQHLLMGCYRATLEYIRSIGTHHLIERPRQLRIPFSIFNQYTGNARIAKLSTALLPAPFHTLYGLAKTDLITAEEKFAAIRLGFRTPSLLNDPRSEQWTCSDLFKFAHQPEGLIHKLWEPLCLATINASIEDASARVFLNVLKIALLRDRQDSTIVLPKVGLSELLIDPAIDQLKASGVTFQFRSHITAISNEGGSYKLKIGTSEYPDAFDAIAVATPPGEIQFPKEIIVPRVQTSPIVNAYFWIDRKILFSPIHAFLNTSLQWAFVKPSVFAPQRLALTVSAANELVEGSNEEVTAILWHDLRNSIPDARQARLLHSQIIKEKRATPLFTPAIFSSRPETTTALSGFYLAGDLVQNGLPATIEGGIQNGIAAARQIARIIRKL